MEAETVDEAAVLLDVPLRTLYDRMKDLGILAPKRSRLSEEEIARLPARLFLLHPRSLVANRRTGFDGDADRAGYFLDLELGGAGHGLSIFAR
jgi:hypothetical protein